MSGHLLDFKENKYNERTSWTHIAFIAKIVAQISELADTWQKTNSPINSKFNFPPSFNFSWEGLGIWTVSVKSS